MEIEFSADVVQGADVGMIQAGDSFGPALETLAALGIVGEMRRKNSAYLQDYWPWSESLPKLFGIGVPPASQMV